MKNLKLNIDLLPRGAWGNDLSNTLSKKDWDKLREFCYNRFENKCAICGAENEKLHAHEVWEFDINNKTQTLVDIVALCPKCHGVKHFRNSERLGFADNAKRHFMQINNCNEIDFADHYTEKQFIFDKLSEIYRWEVICDLSKFGGKGMQVEQKYLPMITNPYEEVEWYIAKREKLFKEIRTDGETNWCAMPKVRFVEVDNYLGTITFVADFANKIEMWTGDKMIANKFNLNTWLFVQEFKVENIKEQSIYFKICNKHGILISQEFELQQIK